MNDCAFGALCLAAFRPQDIFHPRDIYSSTAQTQRDLNGQDNRMFEVIEIFFLVSYSFELSARFFAYGWRCLRNPWVAFDALLVGVGLVSTALEVWYGSASS